MSKLIVLLLSFLSVSTIGAHAKPIEDCESLSSFPQNYEDWFERARCSFGENNGVYSKEHKRFTLIILPSFDDAWLIVLESHPPVRVERSETLTVGLLETTELRFARAANPLGNFIFIDNDDPHKDAIFHERLVQDRYSKPLDLERLEQIFYQLSVTIAEEAPMLDPANGCTDGTTIFVEVVNEGESQLLKKHDCDEGYTDFLKILSPLVEFAIEELLPLENELSDLKAELFAQ